MVEAQIVMVGAVVFIVSAVLIYLISAFTMKEKTFEEVIEEQRRQKELEEAKIKQEKKAEKDARRRKKPKEKSKGDQSPRSGKIVTESVTVVEHKMVNLEIEPEIIEPVAPEVPLKMGKKKDRPTKTILHNRDEKTPVVSEDNVEEFVHGPVPRDDVELKHSHIKQDKKKKDKQKQVQVVEEMIQIKQTTVQAAAPPAAESKVNFKEGGNTKLISTVKTANLSDNETQQLVEILLNKQGGASVGASSGWNKKPLKGDQEAALRRQLDDKEKALQQEQEMVIDARRNVKELKQELKNEAAKSQAKEKQFNEKIEYQAREVAAFHLRLQQTHEQHMTEVAQLRAHIQKLEGQADPGTMQRLVDENKTLRDTLAKTQADSLPAADANNLKQKVSILEKEMSSLSLKLNASENTKRTMEKKLEKAEAELKKYDSQQSNASNVLEKRLDELSQELRKGEAQNTTLTKNLQTKEQAVDMAQKECASLRTKLQELEAALTASDMSSREIVERLKAADRQKIDTDGNLKNLQKKIESLEQEKSGLEKEKSALLTDVQSLKQQNTSLNTELKVSKDTVQTVAAQPNGDVDMISLDEHNKQLSEKTTEVASLAKEIENKVTELQDLRTQVEAQKKKNNDLREKNWKAMDALDKSEKSLNEKVQSAIKTKTEEVQVIQSEFEKYDQSVLTRLFPDISVSNKSNHKDWMTEFEKEVSSHLKSLKQAPSGSSENSAKFETEISDLKSRLSSAEAYTAELESRVETAESELQKAEALTSKSDISVHEIETALREAEANRDRLQSALDESESSCSKLQTQVAQYRNVLGETENKLTQLESSVEQEEKKWQEKLGAKQDELTQLKSEIASLQQQSSTAPDSQEMKEKVANLETQLQASDDRCSQLQSELQQTESKVTEYNIKIVELEKSGSTIVEINTELETIKTSLAAEQKKNKDLASQIVKLNGIIKTGHDALTQEQNLVKKLREQMSNGTDQNSTSVPKQTEDQLRQTLAEKERLLEKEINSNKLLSQRLAQLGVMASSQSSLNEAGTGTSV
ncbi:ribosome-binding protein 1-like isoform X2 [Mya arenaria]|uniref:ribosome-binding protein 1-like isoform X2 n=1 Tax=Mya arenaria TaxID=6604 RepID=UPI0022E1FEB6|nr:ribosome-binding protein 1-like isoform X2 [Mya arenaria]